jgi:hypothetical protein
MQRPQVGLQMLPSPRASVLLRRDPHLAREHRGCGGSPPGVDFLNERAEGCQSPLALQELRTFRPQLHLVERPFPQTTAPTVEGREVRPRRLPPGLSDRRT